MREPRLLLVGSSGQAPGTVRGQSLAVSTQRRTLAGLAGASQQSTAVRALPGLPPFSLPAGVPGPPASPAPSPLPFPGIVHHRCLALYLCHGQCLPKTGSHILANLFVSARIQPRPQNPRRLLQGEDTVQGSVSTGGRKR